MSILKIDINPKIDVNPKINIPIYYMYKEVNEW